MKTTFRAMQITSPGVLEMVERPIPVPAQDEVLIKIEVCGVCGADLHDSEKPQQNLKRPRIPGHEIIGHIAGKGNVVPQRWQTGQRVGVGRLGGYCQYCEQCRNSHFFQALPVTELMPLERANDALSRLREGKARYRIVLTINQDK
ncbi:alcohol dehydrogenase catalytic domain-containing protein [Dickeya fangzhongdai]|uniref:alcohol dehydrogenase catalytic domain-containing protein n=1 Tax=Dickeya fangzhongdai TaxID=1778540 RepID=UPI002B2DC98F|nr:alcohol dehydrogenase catalytic domain-containing protein [Dickeya fangzhongdai]